MRIVNGSAGIPRPMIATDDMTFATYTISTCNVCSAATQRGIKRIAWGSNESVR